MEETKAINLSLMSLKECIRARTIAGAGDGRVGVGETVHVPYRRSKLTMLMKDVFDIGCKRLCSTVVLAHVSPLARDVKHSSNTLQYAAPLRVSVLLKKKKTPGHKYERDSRDPALWTFGEVAAWVTATCGSSTAVTASHLVAANEGGLALCMLPEPEVYRRVAEAFGGVTNESNRAANALYSALWTLICDAKTRKRRPDGSIITEEDEAAEKKEAEKALAAKAALWAEREAHMKSDLVGYDGKPIR
jgi:kinesin family protein 2/24